MKIAPSLKADIVQGKHNPSQRNTCYDVVKAIGIISIVIGHCHPSQKMVDFVYSYHLALFLFMSGVQFNIKKYSEDPFLFLQNRIKSMWPVFFGYLTFFTITHDLCVKFHLLPGSVMYGKKLALNRILNNFIFLGGEILGGALWFVPVMLISLLIFSAIVYFSYTLFSRAKLVLIAVGCCLMGAYGMYYNMNHLELTLHIHTGLLLLPIVYIGFLFTYFKLDFNKVFRWFVALPCGFIVIWLVLIKGYQIELSKELIGSVGLFYPITICGIYFICYFAKKICIFPRVSSVLAFIGRYSFDIMALHFFVFKVIDVIYGRIIGDSYERMSQFPCAYRALWVIYLIASVGIIPWVRVIIQKMYKNLKMGRPIFSLYHEIETE